MYPLDIVLVAEELRYAAHAVGRVAGEIGTEDLLDAKFKGFCIGKSEVWCGERKGRGQMAALRLMLTDMIQVAPLNRIENLNVTVARP